MSMRFATATATATATAMGTAMSSATEHVRRLGRTIVHVCAGPLGAGRAARRRIRSLAGDAGMSTAEYAVGTIAACAFAAVLYQVVTGDSIVSALRDLINSALTSLS